MMKRTSNTAIIICAIIFDFDLTKPSDVSGGLDEILCFIICSRFHTL